MDFRPSAFKHGIAHDDIEHAIRNAVVAEDQADGTRLYLGASRTGNLLEVASAVFDDGSEIVIHAMGMRPKYFRLLQEG